MPTSRKLDVSFLRRGANLVGCAGGMGAWMFVVAGAGCGQAATEASVRDLQTRLAASEHAQADAQKKFEDLDNRMFLLSDQVESQKIAQSRRGDPRLPVITLGPTRGPGGAAEPAALDPPSENRSPRAVATPAEPGQLNPFDSDGVRHSLTLAGTTTPWLVPETEESISESAQPSDFSRAEESGTRPLPPGVASLGVTKAAGARDSLRLAAPAAPSTTPRRPSVVDATARYRSAYAKLKAGQPEVAAEEFRLFVREFPNHDLADNAQYWLGESFYARQAYQEASEEFRTVVRRWPLGNKAPDALLKLGYCLIALGDLDKGRAVLSEVVDHYPRTDAAQLSARRIAELPEKKP